ncbi:MAG: hypothetical protein K2H01_07380, partial [Ruminococcus sp.]|nr:hypothetical protein [Ruminococcus sp.]
YERARSGIDGEDGHQCIFSYNEKELFRGIIMKTVQTNKKIMTFTAYDNGIYLSNNKDTFTYEDKTASEIFKDVCTRFGLPIGDIDNCTYRIPELTKSKTTAFDTIADALSLDYDNTGIRHYVTSDKGKLSLITRRKNILQWVIEAGQNIITYSYRKSIENIKTRVKMLSDEETVLAESRNSALEQKIGIFQDIDKPDETLNEAQIKELCDSMLEEGSTPEKTLTIEAMGNPDVISGIGVFIIIPHLGLSKTFYVDEDTHTFKGNSHRMNLKLNHAGDISKDDSTSSGSGSESTDHQIGDIVQFNGGYHYVSSTASDPTGAPCKAGPAKLMLIAKGAKHPYSLIHTDNQSRVYGWVDEGTFS